MKKLLNRCKCVDENLKLNITTIFANIWKFCYFSKNVRSIKMTLWNENQLTKNIQFKNQFLFAFSIFIVQNIRNNRYVLKLFKTSFYKQQLINEQRKRKRKKKQIEKTNKRWLRSNDKSNEWNFEKKISIYCDYIVI